MSVSMPVVDTHGNLHDSSGRFTPQYKMQGMSDHELGRVAAAQWADAGFSPDEAKAWDARGFLPAVASRWRDAKFTPGAADSWERAVSTPESAVRWRDEDFTPSQAEKWLNYGFTVDEADKWESLSMTPHRALQWRTARFTPEEVDAWFFYGGVRDLDEIVAQRDAGVLPENAEQLKSP